ncbi:GspH/FimT family pseudopilin [Thiolapillus sp.]
MRKNRGFTLVELLITVVVIAILVALATPSFRGLLDRNAAASTANDLLSSILLARSESIKREQPVIFSSDDGFATWQVAADTNGDGTGDDVVLQHNQEDSSASITANGAAAITFNSRGRASLTPGSDYFIITKNGVTRHVCFSSTGRPRVQEEGGCQ